MASGTRPAETLPAYVELRRDVLLNADLWSGDLRIFAAGFGFEGIIGIPGVSATDLQPAVDAGAGVSLDWAALDPTPPLRNLTSGAPVVGAATAGYGGTVVFADAMPIEFSWPLLPSTVSPTDFAITLNTGEVVVPDLAGLNPNFDHNERAVVVVFGAFGNRLAPGTPGAVYPVRVDVVADDTPLMAVGPDGPVFAVGLSSSSSNPYVTDGGPQLVGAKLTPFSSVGDFAPDALANASPNDGGALYGDEAELRLRLFTSGGFSPDGVSGFLPDEFSRYFRLEATHANGDTVVIDAAGVDYDLGVGTIRVVGLAELGQPVPAGETLDPPSYQEDHDNQFDIILAGDAAAMRRLAIVEIPTSAVPGYSDIYNPGGPGRTPQPDTTYTQPAAAQRFPIDVALDDPATVSYAAQRVSDYDVDDGLPVVFQLIDPVEGTHFYTASSNEAGDMLDAGWQEAGVLFSNEETSTSLVEIHRFYSADLSDYILTADPDEIDALSDPDSGYVDQGVVFAGFADPAPGAAPIHRFHSPALTDHLYTPDDAAGVAAGYVYEGIAWYAADLTRILPVEFVEIGGPGDDELLGGPGEDTVAGAEGRDTVFAGAGEDRVRGGAGDDRLSGGPDADHLGGHAGNDRLDGGDGADTLRTGRGDDEADGGDGDDFLGGGDGADRLLGGSGLDTLRGRDGADRLFGEAGDDLLFGGAGNDVIVGGRGDDRLDGGPGRDRIVLSGSFGDDVVAGFRPGVDRIAIRSEDDYAVDVTSEAEGVLIVVTGADVSGSVLLQDLGADDIDGLSFL